MLVCPPGAGKSTLAQGIVAARLGLLGGQVLGEPVLGDGGRVLYLALDRPRQIKRGLRRLFTADVSDQVLDRLVIYDQPLPVDLGEPLNQRWLLNTARAEGASLVVDSLKDAVGRPAEDGPANAYNKARQYAVANGIDVIEVHHDRKRSNDGHGGNGQLDDVYGSRWITAGAGSV
jgi:replicative DNA helicase